MKEKLALAMIVKGTGKEPKELERALKSVSKHVDGIFITLTGPKEELGEAEQICKDFGANVSYERALWTADKKAIDWLREFFGYEPHLKEGDEVFQFDVARNYNFSQIPKDYTWILWLDADDIVLQAENSRNW